MIVIYCSDSQLALLFPEGKLKRVFRYEKLINKMSKLGKEDMNHQVTNRILVPIENINLFYNKDQFTGNVEKPKTIRRYKLI